MFCITNYNVLMHHCDCCAVHCAIDPYTGFLISFWQFLCIFFTTVFLMGGGGTPVSLEWVGAAKVLEP